MMNKYKLTAIITYPILVFLLWIWSGGNPQIFDSISFQAIFHGTLLSVAFLIWVAMVYALITNFFPKLIIQRKIKQAERSLGNVATAKLKTYKPNRTGNYITLVFYSAGIPEEDWEKKRTAIQSAINYTIIEDIKHKDDDYGIIILRVRKGCIKSNMENLYDDEL